MLILANRISNIFWKTSIGFDDRVGNLAFGLSEKAHKGNIYISIAETFGDIGSYTRFILMDDDNSAVFAGEIDLYRVDLYDADFSAAKGLAADSHFLTVVIDHMNVNSIRMNVSF